MDIESNEIVGCFISIPKCASKTILEMFKLGQNRNNHKNYKFQKYIIYENHQRLKILEEKYNLKNVYIFTFVRHPYVRIKSWYYYHKDIRPYKKVSLNDWIKNGCKTHWKIQNETNWEKEKLSPLLQYNFIKGKTNIDYIGKIEDFEKDCKSIISKLNSILKENNLPKKIKYNNIIVNKSINKKEDKLTDESKELIYKMFKKDFEFFKYEK